MSADAKTVIKSDDLGTLKSVVAVFGNMDSGPRIASTEHKPVERVTLRENVHAEIQYIQRIINGANKRLERLCEQIAKK